MEEGHSLDMPWQRRKKSEMWQLLLVELGRKFMAMLCGHGNQLFVLHSFQWA